MTTLVAWPWVSQTAVTQWGRLEPTPGGRYSRLPGLVPVPTPQRLPLPPGTWQPSAGCTGLQNSPGLQAPRAGVEQASPSFPGRPGLCHAPSRPLSLFLGWQGVSWNLKVTSIPLSLLRAQHALEGGGGASRAVAPY